MNSLKSGAAIAAAAAALFATGVQAATPMPAADGGIKCTGINGCKGQSECATAKNQCMGQNACKGQGFTETTKKDCKVAGGQFESVKGAATKPASKS